ncbi:hypothetical protein AZE42_09166 [Rhizopogon vesiculosus]|nr:hypothetical protein AZE42_09166 [Rhizopogon vesiculosus]
MEDEQW